jgi:hypothetical protein
LDVCKLDGVLLLFVHVDVERRHVPWPKWHFRSKPAPLTPLWWLSSHNKLLKSTAVRVSGASKLFRSSDIGLEQFMRRSEPFLRPKVAFWVMLDWGVVVSNDLWGSNPQRPKVVWVLDQLGA